MFYLKFLVIILIYGKLYASDSFSNENKTIDAFIDMVLSNLSACENYSWPTNNDKLIKVEPSEKEKIYDFGTFDFIIVGAGSAGSLLANRLTEIKNWTVLLLEAGGNENEFSEIPGMVVNLILTDMNWGYLSVPQKRACRGMNNYQCIAPVGKVRGGSSTISVQVYARGGKADYDAWEEMGNTGWSYKDVLPYFIKTERSHISDGDIGYHNKEGLLDVSYTNPTIFSPIILKGLEESGDKEIDYNGKNQIGTHKLQVTIKGNKTVSAGKAFIDPILNRKNLNITMNAFVTNLLLDKQNKTAIGVQFIRNGRKYRVQAKKEVILSAGAINTPQILMISGIGPEEELKRIGVETIVDLPVGKALQNHILFDAVNFRTNITLSDDSVQALLKKYINNVGPYTIAYSTVVGGFINTKDKTSPVPDIESLFAVPPGLGPLSSKIANMAEEIEFYIDPYRDIVVQLGLLNPKSRGTVTLKSKNPRDFPLIDLNIYGVEEDMDSMYRGIEAALQLVETDAFKSMNATYSPATNACLNHTVDSKEYWYCLMEQLSSTLYHFCGTTKMGTSKKDSVVTPKLNLHGLNKLRIVDAGVIPQIPTANINAVVYMIAERAADLIKEDYL